MPGIRLQEYFTNKGEKAFRANQVYEWIWKKSAIDFDQMTNLSLSTREMLRDNFSINAVAVDDCQFSKDGTIKNAFRLYDGKICEGVLIPADTRMTACISSQVGCSLACEFCATGRLKLMKNLTAAEMYDQVEMIATISRERTTNNLYQTLFIWGWENPYLIINMY